MMNRRAGFMFAFLFLALFMMATVHKFSNPLITEVGSPGSSATVWDDERVPITSVKVSGTKPPSFEAFIGDVYGYAFEDQSAPNEQEVFFVVQLPHAWKEGSDIEPHIHWAPAENPADASHDVVRWGLECEWESLNGTFSGTTTLYVDAEMGATDAKKHLLSDFGTMTGTGHTLSSMVVCRLFRNSDHANDTYDSKDAFVLEIDFHIEKDMMGSRQELVK